MKKDILIEELKRQLDLIKYDRSKTIYEQKPDHLMPGQPDNPSKPQGSEVYNIAKGKSEISKIFNDALNANTPYQIANGLILSLKNANDDEELAQIVFNRIKNEKNYYDVAYELRDDPYLYIQGEGLDPIDLFGNGVDAKTDYSTKENKKPTIQKKWESLGRPNFPYGLLKKYPYPDVITLILKKSKGAGGDREAWAQAAVYSIKNKEDYYKVTTNLGEDPIHYCEDKIGMDLNTNYIDDSWYNVPAISGWLPDIGKSKQGDLGYAKEKVGAVSYPYGALTQKEDIPIDFLVKVLYQSYGDFTYDKPAWVQAVFSTIITKFSTGERATTYRKICKGLGQDTYQKVKTALSDEGKLSTDFIKSSNFPYTIQSAYNLIKQESKDLNMYYDYTIGSDGMFEILKTKKASPKYVADLLTNSIDYVNTGSQKLGDTAGSTTLGFELFQNDLEDVVVACFMAIPDETFYNQVCKILGKEDIFDYISEYVDPSENYYANSSINNEIKRIFSTKSKGIAKDSKEVIDSTIKMLNEKGFKNITFDDCITSGQAIYKAYIYGFKDIMLGIEKRRKEDYKNLSESNEISKNLIEEGGFLGIPTAGSLHYLQKYVENIGYPNCLEVSCIQMNSSSKETQRMDEKIKLTCGNFGVDSGVAEQAYDNLTDFLAYEDQKFILDTDPNKNNLNLENTYILNDFVDNWDQIEQQYKMHFERNSTKNCEFFPQGPDEFFKYWFGTDNFGSALRLSQVPPPKIYCQAETLRTDASRKEGFSLGLEQIEETLHYVLPITSMLLQFFGGWPGALIGAFLEIVDASIYFGRGDNYMGGLSVMFAILGPLDMKIGELISKSGGLNSFLEKLSVSLKMEGSGAKGGGVFEKVLAEQAFTENFRRVMKLISQNRLKYARLAKLGLYCRIIEKLWIAASKQGGKGYITLIATLANAGLVTADFVSKMTLIIGGGFVTWDYIASLVGIENTMPIAEASKYTNDAPEAHYWITQLFIKYTQNLQPFSKVAKPNNEKPPLAFIQLVKLAIKKKIEQDLDEIINGSKILKLNDTGQNINRIQAILKILKMDKDFSSFKNVAKINPQNLMSLDFYKTVFKNFFGGTDNKVSCQYMMGDLQYYPSEKNKKSGPYKTIIYFKKGEEPKSEVFKKGEIVEILNTNFDGDFKIEEIHYTKNSKILGITLFIPYKSQQNTTLSDKTFYNRGVIEDVEGCKSFYEYSPNNIQFSYLTFDKNMQMAVLNYQIKKDIPQTGVIDKITALKLKEDLLNHASEIEALCNTEEGKELWFTNKEQDDKILKSFEEQVREINGMIDPKTIDEYAAKMAEYAKQKGLSIIEDSTPDDIDIEKLKFTEKQSPFPDALKQETPVNDSLVKMLDGKVTVY